MTRAERLHDGTTAAGDLDVEGDHARADDPETVGTLALFEEPGGHRKADLVRERHQLPMVLRGE